MADPADQWVTVATRLTESRSNELALVLTARGVPFQRQLALGGWELWVPLAMAPVAATELTLYRHENLRQSGARPLEDIGAGRAGVLWYVAVLLAMFYALHTDLFGFDWLRAGRVDAGALLGGQWWRAVTALTLHLELAHLGGNLAFGAFFGYFIGRYFGTGVGWLAVLSAASLGNVVNSWLQSPAHRSIGASTAVFAALGLLVAYTWRRGFLRDTPWRSRIAPIVAGLGLLAFTGTAGENTDLGAHLFGFAAGVVLGVGVAQLVPTAWLKSASVQRACGALAALLLVTAWVVGLRAAG
jgi:membrane associated rhomboid family serine protease